MKLVINLPNDRIEPVAISCINKLYDLTRAGTLDSTSSLVGYINASSAYLDYIDYLRTAWPDLIITATNIYVRFADQEVERVIKTALGKGQDEGVVASELSSFQPKFEGNTVIEYFDEMKYCSPNVTNLAFSNCTNLKSIDLTNITVMSGNGFYFRGCINLEYFHGIDGERGVLNLTNLTFAQFNGWFTNCKKLERIISLGFISIIGSMAFSGCSALESVTGISSVTGIELSAFENCSSLSTIALQSITSIKQSTFLACSNLEYCGGSNSTRGELYLPDLTGTLGNSAFKGCVKLTSVASLGSITSIGSGAFENCTNLATINFPNTITSVGANAFNNTAWFDSQPNGPVIINDRVLYKCKNVSGTIVIPNNIASITDMAFYDCSSLTSVTIGSDVTSIGVSDGVFRGCTALSTVVVDSNNTKYDSRNNCNAIIETTSNKLIAGCKNTTIPNDVTAIGSSAFAFISTEFSVIIPNSVTDIEYHAFYNSNFTGTLTVKASYTLKNGHFLSIKGLFNLVFESGVTEIVYQEFSGSNITGTVLIPSTITKIGAWGLRHDSNIGNVVFRFESSTPPTKVDSSAELAFGLPANTSFEVPQGSLSTYQSYINNSAFTITEYTL